MLVRGADCGDEIHPRQVLGLLPDEQLARRVVAGDRASFTALYERHMPAMVRYCRGILLSKEDAEDAAQSAMVAALESLPGRPTRLQLRAWLFRVAHNEAISLLRRRRPHASLEEAEQVSIADVSRTVAERARLRELLQDLSSLPERQRGALVMRELCGCSYGEIASALGGSEGAAMQAVFEARTAMVQFDRGREVSCDDIQRVISNGDRRALRARRIRAHMRSCQSCREFDASTKRRTRDLAILFPLGAKGGLAGLAALLGLRHPRPNAITAASAMQRMPSGIRAAALAAVVAVGSAITTMSPPKTSPGRAPQPAASAFAVARGGAPGRPAVTLAQVPIRLVLAGHARPHGAEGRSQARPPARPTARQTSSASRSSSTAPVAAQSGPVSPGGDPVSVSVRPGAGTLGAGAAQVSVVSDPSGLRVDAGAGDEQAQLTVSTAGAGAAVTSSVAPVGASIASDPQILR